MKGRSTAVLIAIFLPAVLAACSRGSLAGVADASPADERPVTSTATPFQPAAPTSTPGPALVWLSPSVPDGLQQHVARVVEAYPGELRFHPQAEGAQVRVEAYAEVPLSYWVYALVAPFPSPSDGMSLGELRAVWSGRGFQAVFAVPETRQALDRFLGEAGGVVEAGPDELLERAWSARPSLAIVPFEALQPRWKVLAVDGISPIRDGFDLIDYPLSVPYGLSGETWAVQALKQRLAWPESNRDPDKLTVVVVTGVTALTRATAWRIEAMGTEWPAEHIGQWLRRADITHVSHEVSFSERCPPPDPSPAVVRFCGQPSHLGLLQHVGVDVVELTGNHNMDYGAEPFLFTMALYHDLGWATFGGGRDVEASLQPALIEHNGNRIAFVGCNAAGPTYAWATEVGPGAAPCEYERLFSQVARLRQEGYAPIFTFQWAESYRNWPLPNQQEAFRRAAEAGAVIVSGSQAHQPQGLEFYQGSLIHYGLGNLFFDQMWSVPTRQEMIDWHVFYDGGHISTDLFTAFLEDFAQPRPMTPDERAAFLNEIFAASGW